MPHSACTVVLVMLTVQQLGALSALSHFIAVVVLIYNRKHLIITNLPFQQPAPVVIVNVVTYLTSRPWYVQAGQSVLTSVNLVKWNSS